MISSCRLGSHQAGSASLELVIVTPALLLIMGLIVGAGRLAVTAQTVQQAANQAARSASLARTPAQGARQAKTTASAVLIGQSVPCSSPSVTVEAGALAAPAGTPGTVSVTVTCNVSLADLAVPGLPGSRSLTATERYPIDTYVERG